MNCWATSQVCHDLLGEPRLQGGGGKIDVDPLLPKPLPYGREHVGRDLVLDAEARTLSSKAQAIGMGSRLSCGNHSVRLPPMPTIQIQTPSLPSLGRILASCHFFVDIHLPFLSSRMWSGSVSALVTSGGAWFFFLVIACPVMSRHRGPHPHDSLSCMGDLSSDLRRDTISHSLV